MIRAKNNAMNISKEAIQHLFHQYSNDKDQSYILNNWGSSDGVIAYARANPKVRRHPYRKDWDQEGTQSTNLSTTPAISYLTILTGGFSALLHTS